MGKYKIPRSEFNEGVEGLKKLVRSRWLPKCQGNEKELPIDNVGVVADVFQPRPFTTDPAHVRQLLETARKGLKLEAILVVHVGGKAFVADGHHRLEALRALKVPTIPVRWYKPAKPEPKDPDDLPGWLLSVASRAGVENTYAKLPMTTWQKMEYAWKLITGDWDNQPPEHQGKRWTLSKAEVREATGASDGTIAKMRRCLRERGDRVFQRRWHEIASEEWSNEDGTHIDEKKAELVAAVRKCFPPSWVGKPALIMDVLDAAFPSLGLEWQAERGEEEYEDEEAAD